MDDRRVQSGMMVLAAVVTLVGVGAFGWSLRTVILLYWLENLVIGFWQVVKMLRLPLEPAAPAGGRAKGISVAFFIIHYGLFCLIHGAFLMALLPAAHASGQTGWLAEVPKGMLVLPLWGMLATGFHWLPPGAWISLLGMFLSHGIEARRFLRRQTIASRRELQRLMREPYKHIMVIHVSLLLGALLVMQLGSPMPWLLGIVLGKLGIDLLDLWRAKRGPDAAR